MACSGIISAALKGMHVARSDENKLSELSDRLGFQGTINNCDITRKAIVDPITRQLVLVVSATLWNRNTQETRIDLPGFPYPPIKLSRLMISGEILVLYTNEIKKTEDLQEIRGCVERLRDIVSRVYYLSARKIMQAMIDRVRQRNSEQTVYAVV